MSQPAISLNALTFVGSGLNRPECVLATRAGDLYTADWRGGVAQIAPDGTQALIGGHDIKPNGIALMKDGSFLIANLDDRGGVLRLARDGALSDFLTALDGEPLPPANFVLPDGRDRVWITVSTRRRPRHLAYRADVADGFIVLVDSRGARIVADGLGYTNELRLDADERFLYVNETFGRRLTRFAIGPDGELSGRETVAEFGAGTYPDGLALDAEGGAWITSIVSNRVLRVAPDGSQTVILEDADRAHVERAEQAFGAGLLGRAHLDTIPSRVLKNVSSLAFGGPDLKTAYLGCLLGGSVATFRSPWAGLAPVHWDG